MKLLVVVLCLLSERFLMHSISYQRFSWFGDYCLRIEKMFENNKVLQNPWILLLIIVMPVILTTAIVYGLLHGILFGFVGLLLSAVIFLYCLGPLNAFYPLSDGADADNNSQVGNYFADVNRQLFSVLFWYIVAGPIAVVAYRLIALSCEVQAVSKEAAVITNILEWVPARLTSILYLLVGNFQQGFVSFRQYALAKPDLNKSLLSECGIRAIRSGESEQIPMPLAESLVEYAIIVILVLIALFTLEAWL